MNLVLHALLIVALIFSGLCQDKEICFPTSTMECCRGFHFIDDKCISICEPNCPETQICLQPNKCGCQTGYRLVNNVCRPHCENCADGQCLLSGGCSKCKPMYILTNYSCLPLCRQKCTNGFCSAPNICQCNPGYTENPKTLHCEPICNETCGLNAYCSAPNVCTCERGYHGDAAKACQAWCKTLCKNGDCIGPENCVCHQGFIKSNGICIPDCVKGCMFGDCGEDGVCRCWEEGFVLNELRGICEQPPMIADTADAPILFLPESHRTSTESWCTSKCSNGVCTSDGFCECNKGFVKANSFLCQNSRQIKLFGSEECVEESMCQSFSSSISDQTEDLSTISIENCIEGMCHEQTSSTEEDATTSTPDFTSNCQNGCWGGTCNQGICQCQEGLILNEDTNDCVMPCENTCQNGVCSQEKKCECNRGYVFRNGSGCVPQCDRECVNSLCVAPTHCECLEGDISKLNLSSALKCLPTCEGATGNEGCPNGTCVAVNRCECLEGFIPKPGDHFECVVGVVEMEYLRWKLFHLLWIIMLLAVVIIIVLAIFAQRKMQRASYNVDKIEKYRSTVMFQDFDQPECVL